MKYIEIEIQTNADGTVGTLVSAYDELAQAESKHHSVLSYAAMSELPMHASVLLRSDGAVLASEFYEHVEPEPEPESVESEADNG